MDSCIFHAETENTCVWHLETDTHTLIHTCTSTLELQTKHARGLSLQEKSKGFYKKHSLSMQGDLFLCICEREMQNSNSLDKILFFFWFSMEKLPKRSHLKSHNSICS